MSDPHEFVTSTGSEIYDALGVSVFYVLSDMPWSFSVVAGGGETVRVWVAELPDTVDVSVSVHTDGELTFTSSRSGARRLEVSKQAPEIVIESGFGSAVGRLEISLTPRLVISDTLGRSDAG
jgi:hypothetical protein